MILFTCYILAGLINLHLQDEFFYITGIYLLRSELKENDLEKNITDEELLFILKMFTVLTWPLFLFRK